MKPLAFAGLLLICTLSGGAREARDGELPWSRPADWSENQSPAAPVFPLETRWALREFSGEPVGPRNGGRDRFLQFASAEDHLLAFGNVGCNNFRAGIETGEGNSLRFGPIASTRMACPDLDFEIEFLGALASVDHYRIEENRLFLLRGAEETAVAVLEAAPEEE